jgi:putative addiction module CopG family antidote
MIFALTNENQEFIRWMLRRGKFKNPSEVLREALRRMEREENYYFNHLNSAPQNAEEPKETYAAKATAEAHEVPEVLRSIAKAKRKREVRLRARRLRRKK